MKKYLPYIIVIILLFFLFKKEEPKTITKTKIEYIKVYDTITKVEISKPVVKYVQRVKTLQGKDSIIYVKDSTSIKANEYKTTLKSNNATANLSILTTGELLDVSGVIEYTQKETTLETIKTRNASGLFLYGQGSLTSPAQNIQVGLDYQIKNKFIIGTSVSYDNFSQSINLNVKLGIRIF